VLLSALVAVVHSSVNSPGVPAVARVSALASLVSLAILLLLLSLLLLGSLLLLVFHRYPAVWRHLLFQLSLVLLLGLLLRCILPLLFLL
jgi:hypothetical protein